MPHTTNEALAILNKKITNIWADDEIELEILQHTYMLFAGWEVRIVKNCDRGLENAAFSSRGHSFSLYGPTLSRQITFFFSCSKLVLQITNGFFYATLVIQWACAPSTYDL